MWNEAWEAEERNQSEKAESLFRKSYDEFCAAQNLFPNNRQFSKWANICELKMEGNEDFNEGVELHLEANRLCQKRLYLEACKSFTSAGANFAKGYALSDDDRFQDCLDLVRESINEIKELLDGSERAELAEHFAKLRKQYKAELRKQTNVSFDFDFILGDE